MEGELRKAVLITGPTAAGKTEIAMELYDRIGGESKATLISVDSALVYNCLLYTSPSPRDATLSRMPSSA